MNKRNNRAHAATAAMLSSRDVAVILILITMLFAAAAASGFSRSVQPVRLSAVRIEQGQTLWEIAADVELPGMSTAEKVAEIQRLNDLPGATVVAGSVVKIPAADDLTGAVAMR